jgi:hypothetical protein
MRRLIESLARLRPGPVLLHDIPADCRETEGLRQAYHFLLEGPAEGLPANGSVSLYCHPGDLAPQRKEPDDPSRRLLESYTLAGKCDKVQTGEPVPAWVLSCQRVLEQTVARQLEGEAPATQQQKAVRRGVEEALRYVSDLIARHVDGPEADQGDRTP